MSSHAQGADDQGGGHAHSPVQTAAHTAHAAEDVATQAGVPVPGPAQMVADGLNIFSGAQQMVSPAGKTPEQKSESRGGGLLDILQGAVPLGVELLTHDPMASQMTAGVMSQGRMALDAMMGGGLSSATGGILSSIGSFFGFGGGDQAAPAAAPAAPAAAPAAPAAAPAATPASAPAAAPRVFPNSPMGSDSDVFDRLSR